MANGRASRKCSAIASRIADVTVQYVAAGKVKSAYEPAMRDDDGVAGGIAWFRGHHGDPWIEIDFPSDLIWARQIIYPQVVAAGDERHGDAVVRRR